MSDRFDEMARRIDALERRLRLERRAVAAAAAIAAGTGLAWAHAAPRETRAPAAHQELRARRLALVGADGRTLAALEPTSAGGARLAFLAGDRTPLALEVGPDGAPSLALSDAAGMKRVALTVAGDDARVSVLGPGRTVMALVSDGLAPRLAISDAEGRDRAWLAVRLGSAVLQFLDAQGMARAGLTTFNDDSGVAVVSGTDKSKPGLVLLGRDRSIVWSAP